MSDFIHLHCHSEYSTLDAMPKVEEYIMACNELNFKGIAITDHGSVRSVVKLSTAAKGDLTWRGEKLDMEPIKNIIGCEFYMSPNDYRLKGLPESYKDKLKRKSKDSKEFKELLKKKEDKFGIRKRYHFLIFAKNKQGYRNLLRLNYLAWKNGFYYRPRIDMRLLKKYHSGLVVTSSCIGGVAPNLFLQGKKDEAIQHLIEMKKIFGDDFYLEIQPHNIKEQMYANNFIMTMADELKMKVIATNDCHYVGKDDYKAHETLLNINTKSDNQSTDAFRFGDKEFYLKTKDEMIESFKRNHKNLNIKDVKKALENTQEIAEKCEVEIKTGKKQCILPVVTLPKKYDESDESEFNNYIYDLCKKGWIWRDIKTRAYNYSKFKNTSVQEAVSVYKKRLKLELKRIYKLGFTKYFLIIYDLIKWARDNDIYVGPGRGSSGGSLVCFLLGITSIDPIRYELLFDRFLSEYRIDYPDIDMDFEDDRRMEVFEYLTKKYGEKNACMIGTFSTMKGKAALHDVSRTFGIPQWEVTEVTKHIVIRPEGDARNSQTVEDSFKEFEASKKFNKRYPKVLPLVQKLEGKTRGVGIHACGMVIAPFKMYTFIPVEYRKHNKLNKKVAVSAVDWRDCQNVGLLKIDILGLKTLTSLKLSVKAIKERHGKEIDLEKINLEDKHVLDNFTQGKFSGIFQFDSIGMRKTTEDLEFTSFEDVIAMNALYRPGSMRCISKDTKITIRMKGRNKKTIEQMYNRFKNAPDCVRNVKENYKIISYDIDNDKFVKNRIVDIVKSGKKKVYKMRLRHLREVETKKRGDFTPVFQGDLELTLEHKVLTYDGVWKEAKDLVYGDYVLFRYQNNVANAKRKKEKFSKARAAFYYKEKCSICGWEEEYVPCDVHHIDGNRKNNKRKNLTIVCPNCHRMIEWGKISDDFVDKCRKNNSLDNSYKKQFRWTKFLGLDYIGTKMTYDIVMTSPHNNYIAGGVVVHNSGQAKVYIERKKNKKKIKSVHPIYDDITKGSYGTVIFQEQLMQVFMRVAGYQPSKADVVRKKVAKSTGTQSIWREKEDFMAGAKKNNVPKKVARTLFKNMSFFGSYAFNKAHAGAYSMISYWGMYLKKYYPTEFYYGLMYIENDEKKLLEYIKEAKKYGIKVTMPDINISSVEFSILDDRVISVGLADVKGCGEKASKSIIENQPYTSMNDFCNKVNRRTVNKGVIKALVHAGAFREMYPNVGALTTICEQDKKGEDIPVWLKMVSLDEVKGNELYKEYDKKEYTLNEEEEQVLMSEVSPIPPDKHVIEYYKYLRNYISKTHRYTLIKDIGDEKKIIIMGIIIDIKYNNIGDFEKEEPDEKTKKRMGWGRRYVGLNVEDETGFVRVNINPDVFPSCREYIDRGLGTPIMLAVRTFRGRNMLFADQVIGLDIFRKKIDDFDSVKDSYKAMSKIERYFMKHPVTFIKGKRIKFKKMEKRTGGEFKIIGLVNNVKYHWNKKDKKMAFMEIEDETASINITIWSDELKANKDIIDNGNILQMLVKKNKRGYTVKPNTIKFIKKAYIMEK